MQIQNRDILDTRYMDIRFVIIDKIVPMRCLKKSFEHFLIIV